MLSGSLVLCPLVSCSLTIPLPQTQLSISTWIGKPSGPAFSHWRQSTDCLERDSHPSTSPGCGHRRGVAGDEHQVVVKMLRLASQLSSHPTPSWVEPTAQMKLPGHLLLSGKMG